MKTYIITAKAGRRVAGQPNTGVGTRLTLTEEQAAAALDAGQLIAPSDSPAAGTAENPENLSRDGEVGASGGKGSRKAKKPPTGEKTGV